MKCTRCLAEIPAQSQFCLRCGTAIGGTAANPTGMMSAAGFAPPATNKRFLVPAIIGLLAVLVIALGAVVVRGNLVQKPTETSNSNLVQAPTQSGPSNLVQAPTEAEPSKLVETPKETAPKPTDVMDYLAFLKQIEISKQKLISDELASMLQQKSEMLGKQAEAANSDDPSVQKDFLPSVGRGTNDVANQWDKLTQAFNQRTPPASCVDLRNKYYDQLGKLQSQFLQVGGALTKAQSDPGGALKELTGMLGGASAEADQSIRRADDALADVCNKYRLQKDFVIKGEPSGSGLLQ